MTTNNNVLFSTDQNKKMKNMSIGPKYLVIKRLHENDTFHNVSPFLIKKVIDCVCGEVTSCKKLINGTLLVKTKNYVQASKLIKLTSFTSDIKVDVSEHNSLNTSKGIVYDNSLRGISEEVILMEMKSQNVCEVKKILKREGENLVETGLIIFTFTTLERPNDVHIGYEIRQVRDYVPLPLKCNNCQRFGHLSKVCKNTKICYNCGNSSHTDDQNSQCDNTPCCVNCKTEQQTETNHPSTSKKCPIFLKQKEIQTIKVAKKVDYKTAYNMYKERVQQKNSYAVTARNPVVYNSFDSPTSIAETTTHNASSKTISQSTSNKTLSQTKSNQNQSNTTNTHTQPPTPDKSSHKSIRSTKTNITNHTLSSKGNITILPRNASKRLKRTLKTKTKETKDELSEVNLSEDTTDESVEMQEL